MTAFTFRQFWTNGYRGHRATMADWNVHLTTLFPEVRLKGYIELRGADSQSPETMLAVPALAKGIFYEADCLQAAWDLVKAWSWDERLELYHAVHRQALQARIRRVQLAEVARELVAIAVEGLHRQRSLNSAGQDESIYLEQIEHQVRTRSLSRRRHHREVDRRVRSRHLPIDRGERVPDRGVRRRGLALALVSAAAALAYAPSFSVPFQFDDYARLGQNWALQHGHWVDALLWLGFPRVVPALTLVLNYQLGAFDPLGYHLLNFAVHLLASAGVFELALILCHAPRLRERCSDRALTVATAAAVVFACHPLQTQAVTYIIQRYASIAALFYVWAVVCYLRARGRQLDVSTGSATRYWVATVAFAVCALLSKENAASLPAAFLLAEWTAFRLPRHWRTIAVGAGALLAALLVLLWLTGGEAGGGLVARIWRSGTANSTRQTQFSGGQTPPITYLRTQALVLPRYLRLVALPWGQNVDHDVPLAESLTAPVLAGVHFCSAWPPWGSR